jgi:hypothetical protein
MRHFYAYEPSGRIVMTGICQDEDLELQAVPGAAIAEGQADYRTQYRSATGQLENMPPRPGPYHHFDYGSSRWKLDAGQALDAVRSRRDAMLADTDWVTLRAQERGEPVPPEWLAYRQALRDITQQGVSRAIVWPTPPYG